MAFSSRFKKAAAVVSLALGISLGAAELLVENVAESEGEVRATYQDIVGINTACFGDTDKTFAIPGRTFTAEECLDSLTRQIIAHAKPMLRCIPGVEKSDEMTAAFGWLTFNIGEVRFCSSTAAKKFRAGDYEGACAAILLWNKAGGKVVKGLVTRRAAEAALCRRGIPAMERYRETMKERGEWAF